MWEFIALVCAFGLGACISPLIVTVLIPKACEHARGLVREANELRQTAREQTAQAQLDLDAAIKLRTAADMRLIEAQALSARITASCVDMQEKYDEYKRKYSE